MSDIQQIELSISEAREKVSRRDMALKLASNREFKKLILEGYLKDEAVRLVSISADPRMPKDSGEEITNCIKGISVFQQFMQTIVQHGNMAERELIEQEEVLDELRAEEAGDEVFA